MISKLRGILESHGSDWIVIDVNGVGYMATCSRQTLNRLPSIGDPFSLYTETYLKNEQVHLCGFHDPQERATFRLLTTVQGVGTRVAMAILSVLTPEELTQAIYHQDRSAMSRADGVGPKLATRILMELKDKAATVLLEPSESLSMSSSKESTPSSFTIGKLGEDAVSALINLGYRPLEARQIVRRLLQSSPPEIPLETLIRQSLQELTQNPQRYGDAS